MNARNQELNEYVLRGQGISRTKLNVMCFIGLFIFGWLLGMAFHQMGKKTTGLCYVVPLVMLLIVSLTAPGLGFLVPVIYIFGWIHANTVLSRLQSLARQRIAEIEAIPSSDETADDLLELALLESKVLRRLDQAMSVLTRAIELPGGDPQLLNLVGDQLLAAKRFTEAKQVFERALEDAREESLVKQVKRNLKLAERRARS